MKLLLLLAFFVFGSRSNKVEVQVQEAVPEKLAPKIEEPAEGEPLLIRPKQK